MAAPCSDACKAEVSLCALPVIALRPEPPTVRNKTALLCQGVLFPRLAPSSGNNSGNVLAEGIFSFQDSGGGALRSVPELSKNPFTCFHKKSQKHRVPHRNFLNFFLIAATDSCTLWYLQPSRSAISTKVFPSNNNSTLSRWSSVKHISSSWSNADNSSRIRDSSRLSCGFSDLRTTDSSESSDNSRCLSSSLLRHIPLRNLLTSGPR